MATKSRDTEEKILEAALALFRERGFAEATMRDVAARAGVATGLAYYYFDSKDAIVQKFYHRAKDELAPKLDEAHRERTLAARVQALIEAKFTYFAPNRRFLGALMAHAADPASPLSPFGEPSRPIREYEFAQFERALQETRTAMPRDLAPHMARILWFYQMGMILFWIYDPSPKQKRSRDLVRVSLGIVTLLIKLSNVPLIRPVRRKALEILSIVEGS
jgi:AcrR family transcriptional regulator